MFVIIGRASHSEALDFDGIPAHRAPVSRRARHGVDRLSAQAAQRPHAEERPVRLGDDGRARPTFRLLLGDTAEIGFVVVTALAPAAFLIGWRAVRWLLQLNKPVPQRAKDPRRSGNPARRNAGSSYLPAWASRARTPPPRVPPARSA